MLVSDSFSGNSLVYLIVLFRQTFPLVSVIGVVGLANLSCCCDHVVHVNQTKKCETKDYSIRTNFVLETRDQRFSWPRCPRKVFHQSVLTLLREP